MTPPLFDVLIIGSGPAGVSAAFPLVQAGLSVAMVDGANDGKRSNVQQTSNRIIDSFGSDYSSLVPFDERSPKQRLHRSSQLSADYNKQTKLRTQEFKATGAITRGGLSTLWGAYATEFDDEDLKEYPFNAMDLRESYTSIAQRIGISGTHDDALDEFHGLHTPLQPPPLIHPTAALLLDKFKAAPKKTSLTLGLARNAILTRTQNDRQACVLCKGCLWPCPNDSIYSSLHDLVQLKKFTNFTLIDNFYVDRLQKNLNNWQATALSQSIQAKRIFLAAGTISTTNILLKTLQLPKTSLSLLSNPVVIMPFLMPRAMLKPSPLNGYSLAQLGLKMDLGSRKYLAGAVYCLDGIPLDFMSANLPFSLATSAHISSWVSNSIILVTAYFDGATSDNKISTDARGLNITGGLSSDFETQSKIALMKLRRAFYKLGAVPLPGTKVASPGVDNHLAGTCPMGGSGPLATDSLGQLLALKGVHVVDGASLPTLPAKHLTFSIMANADRISKKVLMLEAF